MKCVWLVLQCSTCEEDEPVRVLATKAEAKGWVKNQGPTVQFRYEDRELVVAGSRGKDSTPRYVLRPLPFGGDLP